MAEQTFKSPGFFEREIEIISRPQVSKTVTPAGIVGTAQKGPAFVPTYISNTDEFFRLFGDANRNMYSGYAVSEYFSNNPTGSVSFCRVLGTGLNSSSKTHQYSGFKLDATRIAAGDVAGDAERAKGAVHFIVANHKLNSAEHLVNGYFNDNDSIKTNLDSDPSDNNLADDTADDTKIQLVRAVIFTASNILIRIGATNESFDTNPDVINNDVASSSVSGRFKLFLVNKNNNTKFSEYTVSLDESSADYISKVLNTDSFSFTEKGHYLYADFPVEELLASTSAENVAVLTGKDAGGYLDAYGDFESRYSAPKTTMFISQPFGEKEYDLFRFESLDDGSYASGKYKISIVGLRASTETNYKFGTFGVQLRDMMDTDDNPVVYEAYSNLSLDPNASNFISRVIGDQKLFLNLDTDSEDEKRLVREGTFPNKSTRIRVVVSNDVLRGEIPEESLPFGFRGIPTLKTTSTLKDGRSSDTSAANSLLTGKDAANILFAAAADNSNKLGYSMIPPMPYRFKVTKGSMQNTSNAWFQKYLGQVFSDTDVKLTSENVQTSFYWGLKNTKIKTIENPNNATQADFNRCVLSLTKFLGKETSSVLTQDEESDIINNNKFSLAKVAFAQENVSDISGPLTDVFLEAVYIRNADVGSVIYDSVKNKIHMSKTVDPFSVEATNGAKDIRATFASLLAEDAVKFNKYNLMAKFTAPFYGGFDGLNILDRDDYYMTDKSTSTEEGGHANEGGYSSGLAATSGEDPMQGVGVVNNGVMSYKNAIKLMTDEMVVTNNILVVPGIRESLITDYAARRVKSYGKAIYLMDIPHYDKDAARIYTTSLGLSSGRPDVDITTSVFDAREVNSSYVATYFPDVVMQDIGDDPEGRVTNLRSIKVPSSVVALGALAKTDSTGTPWFAPAGFSRGALANVVSTDVRLNSADRDTLYEGRINPIANFPNNQFVIFGQKTTQIARTALDRVNVRRLMVRIKSEIEKIAQRLLFEQNDTQTRNRFISSASSILQQIQINQGIEGFRVIMDDTNNTQEDVENNRLNGKIIVIPTRAVEYIAMDFVITNSGVEFPS